MRFILFIFMFLANSAYAQVISSQSEITVQPLDPIVEDTVVIKDIEKFVNEVLDDHENIKELQESHKDQSSNENLVQSYVDQILSNSETNVDPISEDDLKKYGYNENVAEHSIGIEITALSENMRQARMQSIDKAVEFGINQYLESISFSLNGFSLDELTNKFIEKVLIIDEEYDLETLEYKGYFDVWIYTDKIDEFALGVQELDIDVTGPEWVLVFPSEKVDNLGNWTISNKNSLWSDTWKIPSMSNKTQFVRTSADIDDINEISSHSSIESYSEFIANKYNAPSVLYVFYDGNENIELLYWDNINKFLDKKIGYLVNSSVNEKDINFEQAKKAIINDFWVMLSKSSSYYEEPKGYQSSSIVGIEYQLIGEPTVGDNYITASIIIDINKFDIDSVKNSLLGLNGISVRFMEQDANSLVMDITMKTVFDLYEFNTIMSQLGFLLIE